MKEIINEMLSLRPEPKPAIRSRVSIDAITNFFTSLCWLENGQRGSTSIRKFDEKP